MNVRIHLPLREGLFARFVVGTGGGIVFARFKARKGAVAAVCPGVITIAADIVLVKMLAGFARCLSHKTTLILF